MRRLYQDRILAGFAGGTADAFTLFERFEAKLEKHQGNLMRSAVELAKDWRTDRILRRLEAMLAVADRESSLIITGTGDVLEPEHGLIAIGSGGPYAQAAARALLENTELDAEDDRQARASAIAGELCIYTNQNIVVETLNGGSERSAPMSVDDDPARNRPRARQAHRRPGRRQARGRDRAAQPLAPPAGAPSRCARRSRRRTS